MNKYTVLFSMLFSQIVIAAPSIGPAPVKHLYVPQGFDSNDTVEVVVTGNFPNPCYSRNTVVVDVIDDQINVEVSALNSEKMISCPDIIVPFKEVVSVGNLQGGDYQITVNGVLKDKLVVAEANSNSIDDHLYAAIDNIEKKSLNDYVLHGWRYSPCIELDRIDVISNGKDTLSVLPVMKQVSSFCPMKMIPVSYPVKLNFGDLKSQDPLIYIRTMDGKSFNSIIHLGDRR